MKKKSSALNTTTENNKLLEYNFLSGLFFSWMTPLFLLARRKAKSNEKEELELEDLFQVRDQDQTRLLEAKFKEGYKSGASTEIDEEKVAHAKFMAGMKAVVGRTMFIAGLIKVINSLLQVFYPVFLNGLLTSIQKYTMDPDGTASNFDGYYWALGMTASMGLKALTENAYFWYTQTSAWRARSVISTLVFEKSVLIGEPSRAGYTAGKLMNMMTLDTTRIDNFLNNAHVLWDAPFQLVCYIIVLYYYIGWSSFIGLLVLVVATPTQVWIMKKLTQAQKRLVLVTDTRIRLINEALSAITGVKLSSYEEPFLKEIDKARHAEVGIMRSTILLRAFSSAYMMSLPAFVSVVSLSIFAAVQKGQVDAAVLFTAVSILGQLRPPLMLLPMMLAAYAEAKISAKRLAAFLAVPETPDNRTHDPRLKEAALEIRDATFYFADPNRFTSIPAPERSTKTAAKTLSSLPTSPRPIATGQVATKSFLGFGSFRAANPNGSKRGLFDLFEWKKKTPKGAVTNPATSPASAAASLAAQERPVRAVLHDINLVVNQGECVAIVGGVASGKTALIQACIGEMYMEGESASITVSTPVTSFVAEEPWLKSASIKENVLFGLAPNEELYQRILLASQLEQDIATFPDGDATIVGEKGIVLSGGQRARVAIARATYHALMSPSSLVVFDSALKALDPEVAARLFDSVVLDLLREKTRILALNQLHVLPKVDKIVVLENGRIAEIGSYQELSAREGGYFAGLLAKHNAGSTMTSSSSISPATSITSVETAAKPPPKTTDNAVKKDTKTSMQKNASSVLMTKEERAKGSVQWKMYTQYVSAGTWTLFSLMLVGFLFAQAAAILNNFWLSFWSSDEQSGYASYSLTFWLVGFFLTALLIAVLTFARSAIGTEHSIVASTSLHAKLVNSVIHAPLSFHNTTPLGRILSRASADVSQLDTQLSNDLQFFLFSALFVLASIGTIIYATPWFAISLPFFFAIYGAFFTLFRRVIRDAKRLEALVRSPVIADFSEALSGVSTIRAFHFESAVLGKNEGNVNNSVRVWIVLKACERWLSVRLEYLGTGVTFLAAMLAVASAKGALGSSTGTINAGTAGVSLSFATMITAMLNSVVRSGSLLEADMNAAVRVIHYGENVEQEKLHGNRKLSEEESLTWPRKGEIQIRDLRLRYRKETPEILHGINLQIRAGSKVGLVGRSGSGKSSLFLALMRLVEPEPNSIIEIDGVNILDLDLKDLRSRISVVPQTPVIFSGTVRSNLSPFQEYTDEQLNHALARVGLQSRFTLDSEVKDSGLNLSSGERQLLCIARAVLRNARILLLDEHVSALSQISPEFALIEKVLRESFSDATILTIAHNLDSILTSSDEVVVMGDGNVLEQGSPSKLLSDPSSEFFSLVSEVGNPEEIRTRLESRAIV